MGSQCLTAGWGEGCRWSLRLASRCWPLQAPLACCLLQPAAGMANRFPEAAPHIQVAQPQLMGSTHTVPCHPDPRYRLMTGTEKKLQISSVQDHRMSVPHAPGLIYILRILQHCSTHRSQNNVALLTVTASMPLSPSQ